MYFISLCLIILSKGKTVKVKAKNNVSSKALIHDINQYYHHKLLRIKGSTRTKKKISTQKKGELRKIIDFVLSFAVFFYFLNYDIQYLKMKQ